MNIAIPTGIVKWGERESCILICAIYNCVRCWMAEDTVRTEDSVNTDSFTTAYCIHGVNPTALSTSNNDYKDRLHLRVHLKTLVLDISQNYKILVNCHFGMDVSPTLHMYVAYRRNNILSKVWSNKRVKTKLPPQKIH